MSTIFDGQILESDLSKKSWGGTEQMRSRLMNNVDVSLLNGLAVHLSRPQKIHESVNVFWAHDLPDDGFVQLTQNFNFDYFVFVSAWQRDKFVQRMPKYFNGKNVRVIQNAVEESVESHHLGDVVKFVYHTTPHRGLDYAMIAFEHLRRKFGKKVEFHVFSSFNVYGWSVADDAYNKLFEKLKSMDGVTYYGAQPNSVVRKFLIEEASAFLYPCKWPETSCIAMIEALAAGVPIIHPSVAALPETASGSHLSWSYDETRRPVNDVYKVANRFVEEYDSIHVDMLAQDHRYVHTIGHFSAKWKNLLEEIQSDRR